MTREISFNEAEANLKAFITDEGDSGRLDAWLAQKMAPDYSRSRIKALIEAGAVTINGAVTKEPKKKIASDMSIEVILPEITDAEPQPENIPLEIIYEDDDLIVVNKPIGLVVHPGAGNTSGTLVNALLYHCGASLSGIGGVKRPGIVHRLDKDTSGVMVVAKHDIAHRHLSEQFADHGRTGELERAYLALVWGAPNPIKSTIRTFLGRSSDRLKRAVCSEHAPDAKHAVTHYKTKQSFGGQEGVNAFASLVECRLETGRTHQIRVHMAHNGHPLIGDLTYGAAFKTKANKLPDEQRNAINAFTHQALHAYLLQFKHPVSGEIMRFEAELPADFANLTKILERIEL